MYGLKNLSLIQEYIKRSKFSCASVVAASEDTLSNKPRDHIFPLYS